MTLDLGIVLIVIVGFLVLFLIRAGLRQLARLAKFIFVVLVLLVVLGFVLRAFNVLG